MIDAINIASAMQTRIKAEINAHSMSYAVKEGSVYLADETSPKTQTPFAVVGVETGESLPIAHGVGLSTADAEITFDAKGTSTQIDAYRRAFRNAMLFQRVKVEADNPDDFSMSPSKIMATVDRAGGMTTAVSLEDGGSLLLLSASQPIEYFS